MLRPSIIALLVTGAAAGATSLARADTCDLVALPIPVVVELPAGCPLAVSAPAEPLPGVPHMDPDDLRVSPTSTSYRADRVIADWTVRDAPRR